jgi:beta-glucosidase
MQLRLPVAALVVAALVIAALVPACSSDTSVQPDAASFPYRDPALSIDARVEDLLARMTLDDKLGQMTQPDVRFGRVDAEVVTELRLGSVLSGGDSAPAPATPAGWAGSYDRLQAGALATPLGIPLLYAVDAVHGHAGVVGATVFPHNLGLGATRDAELAERIGQVTAVEIAATGLDWTYAPCIAVVQDDHWGRTYESFGEVPALSTAMTSVITGIQGSGVMATAATTRATPCSTRRRCARCTCRRSRRRSIAASAPSWRRTRAGTARRCTATATSSPTC